MRITIHRGSDQIGGCVTEYEYDGWRLFVDYGEQLPGAPKSDKPLEIEGLTKGDLSKSALLITHYHGDHIGKVAELDSNLPIYMGKICCDIIEKQSDHLKTADEASAELLKRLPTVKTFRPGEVFAFGPFTIMPVTIDHSAFDAYAFRIEADDFSVFHTGDFRTHGFRSRKLPMVIEKFVGKVDYVVCEATNVKRPDATSISEHELQQKFKAAFKKNKYNIVYLSSTNIDRLFALYHAAVEAGRKFIVDSYQKDMMDIVTQRDSMWGKSRLYKYLEGEYDQPMDLMKNGREFLVKEKFRALLEGNGYVLIARANPRFDCLISKLPGDQKKRYLSMWNGYLIPGSPAFNKTLATSIGQDYEYLHTSGHCDMASLKSLLSMLHPKAVIPIHTDDPETFANLFADEWPVVLLNDGESIVPISAKYYDNVHAEIFAATTPDDDLSEIYNEENYKWWSLDNRFIGDARWMKEWTDVISRIKYAPSRLLGFVIDEEEDMYPNRDVVYGSNYELLSRFSWGGHEPGGDKHQEMGWLKPGDKVLAVIHENYNVVIPCEVVGPITEEFMKAEIEADPLGPGDYNEVKDDLTDWSWDCVIVRPLVRLKNEFDEMREKMLVQRIYCFPYKEFDF